MSEYPLVTFGFVNCNRLFYLKSCIESLLICTEDYPSREFIVVDNHSLEAGTGEYLSSFEERGFKIIKKTKRDPKNEFAIGLNEIVREAKGDFIFPLQGDMQFILKGGWLKEYVDLYRKYPDNAGCITLDAQRGITLAGSQLGIVETDSKMNFFVDYGRPPTCGAGDVMYSRKILEKMGPWSEKNNQHEYEGDSETNMLNRVKEMQLKSEIKWFQLMPSFPVAVATYTDDRGTNARIRGRNRYGGYWEAKEDNLYYSLVDFIKADVESLTPYSIETVAKPIGWKAPIDENGVWRKNPIRPETALESEYTVLPYKDYDFVNENEN